MENNRELIDDITALTARIREQHPELSLYLSKLPVAAGDKDEHGINTADLRAYYKTLQTVLTKYALEDPATLNR